MKSPRSQTQKNSVGGQLSHASRDLITAVPASAHEGETIKTTLTLGIIQTSTCRTPPVCPSSDSSSLMQPAQQSVRSNEQEDCPWRAGLLNYRSQNNIHLWLTVLDSFLLFMFLLIVLASPFKHLLLKMVLEMCWH